MNTAAFHSLPLLRVVGANERRLYSQANYPWVISVRSALVESEFLTLIFEPPDNLNLEVVPSPQSG